MTISPQVLEQVLCKSSNQSPLANLRKPYRSCRVRKRTGKTFPRRQFPSGAWLEAN
jgi:hypothetical protein